MCVCGSTDSRAREHNVSRTVIAIFLDPAVVIIITTSTEQEIIQPVLTINKRPTPMPPSTRAHTHTY